MKARERLFQRLHLLLHRHLLGGEDFLFLFMERVIEREEGRAQLQEGDPPLIQPALHSLGLFLPVRPFGIDERLDASLDLLHPLEFFE